MGLEIFFRGAGTGGRDGSVGRERETSETPNRGREGREERMACSHTAWGAHMAVMESERCEVGWRGYGGRGGGRNDPTIQAFSY